MLKRSPKYESPPGYWSMAIGRIMAVVSVHIVGACATLFGVSVLFFILTEWLPGDFASATATRDTLPETMVNLRFELGLVRDVSERYWGWVSGVLVGDFGVSWYARRDVIELIGSRFWHSLWLAGWATLIAVPTGVALGIFTAAKQGSRLDRFTSAGSLAAISVPDFVVAYAFMALLGVYWKVFPVFVVYDSSLPWGERLMGTGLPVLSLAFVSMTPILRITRASIINVLGESYIEMARLKGMSTARIVLFHALPNAIGPIANAVVLVIGNLLVGLVVIETVFSYPGLGELLITAVTTRDIPLVQACGLLSAVIYLGLNLLADLISTLSNPKLLYAQPLPAVFSRAYWQWKFADLIGFVRRPWVVPVATACVLLWGWIMWGPTLFPHNYGNYVQPLDVAPVKAGERARLTVEELQSPPAGSLVHFDNFLPIGAHGSARAPLQGRIKVPSFRMQTHVSESRGRTTGPTFPGFTVQVFTSGNQLVPVERDRLLSEEDPSWRIIVMPGRVWSEESDRGWSRAALPFTMVRRRGVGSLNGVATFLYNDSSVSEFRFQIAQEQIPGRSLNAWGQTAFSYEPGALPDVKGHREAFEWAEARRLKFRPWNDLRSEHGRALDAFDGKDGRDHITVSGLLVDDVIYVRACRTRAGPYPFCARMRNAVYSVSKSIGAAAALFRLAHKYGPEVMDLRIIDYAPVAARHDGWAKVTFRHALNMTTGIGDLVPIRSESYVDVDSTRLQFRVYGAETAEKKLKHIGAFANYPWGPGEVFRYRTSDTDLLAIAMDRFLKSKEGPDANLWAMMTEEVFRPLGIERIPVRQTEEDDVSARVPVLGSGMLPTIGETLKLARLFQNGGVHDGRQLLHKGLTEKAASTDPDRGILTGWVYEDGTKSSYDQSFWLMPFTGRGGCTLRIPAMAGYGGNYVILMPNNVVGFRFADGRDDAPGTWVSKHIREVADRVRSVCG